MYSFNYFEQRELNKWFPNSTILSEGTLIMILCCIILQMFIRCVLPPRQASVEIHGFPLWQWASKCIFKILLIVIAVIMSIIGYNPHISDKTTDLVVLSLFVSTMAADTPLCCPHTQARYVLHHLACIVMSEAVAGDDRIRPMSIIIIVIIELGSLCMDFHVMSNTPFSMCIYVTGMTMSNLCGFILLLYETSRHINTSISEDYFISDITIVFLTSFMIAIRQQHVHKQLCMLLKILTCYQI